MAARRVTQIETPETPNIEVAAEVRHGDVDRVAVISRRADGEPDQTPDFEVIE
ncbi:MAG TPA: hypothetical protein PKA99_14735 [Dermatophilaceae bacterium]|jgi:hypothetical protein|nr:hypothetical protein [Dermatophilaceae bacterium]